MIVGKHEESQSSKTSLLCRNIPGYLPIAWLDLYNPDINWNYRTFCWWSDHCKKNCIPSTIKVDSATIEQMLEEDSNTVYQLGSAIFYKENEDNILTHLFKQYCRWADIFSQEKINKLPEHFSFNHKIDLFSRLISPFQLHYYCSTSELKAIKEWLDREYGINCLCKLSSSATSPILLLSKPDSTLYLSVDYRELDNLIVKRQISTPTHGWAKKPSWKS